MALLDLATFRLQYPEFDGASDALVTYVLDQAGLRTPENIWGNLQAEGHGLLTAHLLSMRPEARDMRIGDGKGLNATFYGQERARLNMTVASGFRVTGSE